MIDASKQEIQCKWCTNVAANSHLIPRAIRQTANELLPQDVYGLRNLQIPNRVVQDIAKLPLLCRDCDNLFSSEEGKFLSLLYKPLLSGVEEFEYDDWLSTFAISLAWKTLSVWLNRVNAAEEDPNLLAEALKAAESWKLYLQGKSSEVAPYEHHILFTRLLKQPLPSEFAPYIFRTSFDTTPVTVASDALFISTIFPGCLMISTVTPKTWNYSKDSLIRNHGKFVHPQLIDEKYLRTLVQSYEEQARESASQITPNQRKEMAAATARMRAKLKLPD